MGLHVLFQLICQVFLGLFFPQFEVAQLIADVSLVAILAPGVRRAEADIIQTGGIAEAKDHFIEIQLTAENDREIITIKGVPAPVLRVLQQIRGLGHQVAVLRADEDRQPGVGFERNEDGDRGIVEIHQLVADAAINAIEFARGLGDGLIPDDLGLQRPPGCEVQLTPDARVEARILLSVEGPAADLHQITAGLDAPLEGLLSVATGDRGHKQQ
jgi:hypothetical protein